MTVGQRDLLERAVVDRKNIVVSGGTGTGKTTLLNALAGTVPAGERIVTIEDAAELRFSGHVVRLEARPANAEGQGRVSLADLVRTALRLRPDRIIVGEVRGPEALDMISVMNTGHDGSLSTVHANGPEDALWRLETLALSGESVGELAVRRQLRSGVDIIVHLSRRDAHRFVGGDSRGRPGRMPGTAMLIIALVAVGIGLRPHRFWEPLALGAAVILPWWASLAGLSIGIWVARRSQGADPYQEVAYLQAVSAELRSGRSIRQALVEAGVRTPDLDLAYVARLARSGRPMGEVAEAASAALPGTGSLAAAAMRIGAESGGRVAPAFATLAGIQADRIELGREVRAAGAGARASVAVLTVLPIGGLFVASATGMLSELLALGRVGPVLVGVGSLLLVSGAVATLALGRRLS